MRKTFALYVVLLFFTTLCLCAQNDQPDTVLLSHLKGEGLDRSQVMSILSMLTDINGSRLTGSKGYSSAATYTRRLLESWGVENVHFDIWDDKFGKGWELE